MKAKRTTKGNDKRRQAKKDNQKIAKAFGRYSK